MTIKTLTDLTKKEIENYKSAFSRYFSTFYYKNFDEENANSVNAKFLIQATQTYFPFKITLDELNVENKKQFLISILSSLSKIIVTDNESHYGLTSSANISNAPQNLCDEEKEITEEE